MRTLLLLCSLTLLQSAPYALAQNNLPCDGDPAIVRVSTIKPGKMQAFMDAVAAHKQWYRSHGYKDNVIVASKVVNRDEKTGATSYSETEIMTVHLKPPTGVKTDEAWDAYVKQYRDSSDIKSEYRVCMPKLVP